MLTASFTDMLAEKLVEDVIVDSGLHSNLH